ncbi:MAG TPA: RDD family protein [Pyrinomonadaceae bacterium]|nr:RDD family protein [Pyrinomonadaceae bacterium]
MSSPVVQNSYAGVIRRLGAYAVDAVLLFVAFGLLLGSIVGLVIYLTVGFDWMQNGWLLWAYVFTVISFPLWLYYSLFESSARQATIGMKCWACASHA